MEKKYPEPFKREAGRKGAPYYFVRRGPDGRRRNVSTGETAKERARNRIREMVDHEAAGASELTFAAYAAPYYRPATCPHFARLRDEGKSIGLEHLAHNRALLEKHILTDAAFSSLPVAKIRRADLLDLRQRLKAAGMRPNTLNKTIAAAKTILSEAAFRGDIDNNPGSMVGDLKYAKRERGVLTPIEVSRILSFLSERTRALEAAAVDAKPVKPGAARARAAGIALQAVRDEALVSYLFASGARSGELRALRWSSVNLETGRVKIIEAHKGKDGLGLPKWNKTREIVLARLALDRLKTWRDRLAKELGAPLAASAFVFGDLDGKPLGYEGAHNVLEKILDEARAEGILPKEEDRWLSPHCARHSLNTNLLAAGVSPLLVQAYLGWSSAESKILTRVQAAYTHLQLLRIEDVAEVVDRIYAQDALKVKRYNIRK